MTMTRYANDIISGATTIRAIDCCDCGVTFGINAHWEEQRRKDHRWWYCPNGCRQYFPGKTEGKRAIEQAKYLRSQLTHTQDQLDATERSRRAYKGQVTKIKRRVGKGVCPCCNRSFQDLAAHMETKHPDYAESDLHQP